MESAAMNLVAIAAATLAGFAVGSVWYSPLLFAKPWTAAVGLDPDHMAKADLPKLLGASVASSLATAIGLSAVLPKDAGLVAGLLAGLGIAAAFIVPYTIQAGLYERRSRTLLAINAGHQLASMAVVGAVVGAF